MLPHLLLGLVLGQQAIATEGAPPPAQAPAAAAPDKPWRAHEWLGRPWLRFNLEHRSRYERLDNDFRTANTGGASGVSARTLLSAELRLLPAVVGAEVMDARAWTAEGTPLGTTVVNPFDLLQAYAGLRAEGLVAQGDTAALSVGRMTMDVGSRRLVARSDFRNTINAFTGLDAQWTGPGREVARAFVVAPVVRRPVTPEALDNNRTRADRENTKTTFWGAFFSSRPIVANTTLEAYVLGLHERDMDIAPSSNRRLLTPGVRALRAPAPDTVDFQLEAMGQVGQSRASTAPGDAVDLDHRAFSMHATAGYRVGAPWSPRLALQYDYASGDRKPDDGMNQRFDPLFGARRFDFGPTGLYGAFARSNVSSPGLRLEAQPRDNLDLFAAYRLFWLAAGRDAWTTAGVRDISGAAGTFVGQQAEARVRWHIFPKNLALELGGAVLTPGRFAKRAPGGDSSLSAYGYTQVTGTI